MCFKGIPHPVFYGDLVYKLRRVKSETNFGLELLYIALYSKTLNPTPHFSRGSSVVSALDLESKGCWFEPTVRHYFSSNNVRLLA